MFLKKSVICAMVVVLGVACLPQQGLAQQNLSPDAVEKVLGRLSVGTVKLIQRQPKDALRILMTHAFKCSADGVVTKENDEIARLIAHASMRSQRIQPFLQMDLNADGDVTRAEFESFTRTQDPAARVRSELAWAGGDADGDGVMTIAEILVSAQSQVEMNNQRRAGMRNIPDEIMLMDVDGDGRVTIAELLAVVDAVVSRPIR